MPSPAVVGEHADIEADTCDGMPTLNQQRLLGDISSRLPDTSFVTLSFADLTPLFL
jgi:hypothetical protein